MLERQPVEVQNYADDPRITDHFVDIVTAEGLGGMVAVPVEHESELVGLLYGGVRSIGSIGERAKIVLQQAASDVAPMMAASIQASATIQQRVDAERQRIASDLHDDVGQLLFAICVAAQRLRSGSEENMSAAAKRIEVQAQEATQRLREAFQIMVPGSSCEAVSAAIQREIDDLQTRSGIAAHFVVRGPIRPLPSSAEAALVGACRQALFNVERHAGASLVVATLHFDDSAVSLVVQDDGSGLPEGFELGAIPRGDQHWGLASILRQAQRQGGELEIRSGEDGGTTIRVTLPVENAPTQG